MSNKQKQISVEEVTAMTHLLYEVKAEKEVTAMSHLTADDAVMDTDWDDKGPLAGLLDD